MHCERYEAELTLASIGSQVSPDLERHLDQCSACRGRVEAERRLMESAERGLRDVLRIEPSPGFEARLLLEARRSGRAPSAFSLWPPGRGLALAAGLGFLLVAGRLAWDSQRPTPLPRLATTAPPAPAPAPRESAPEPRIAVDEPPRPMRPRPSSREPEVLVPPGREEALVEFVSMLRDPRVVPPKALTNVIDPQTPLPDPEPLEIPDLDPGVPSDTAPLDGRSQS